MFSLSRSSLSLQGAVVARISESQKDDGIPRKNVSRNHPVNDEDDGIFSHRPQKGGKGGIIKDLL